MVYVAVTECQAKLTQVFSYGIVYLHFYEIKRYIAYNARLILDMIEDCEKYNKPGAIICLDFEKAFDSLSWDFMFAKNLDLVIIFNSG